MQNLKLISNTILQFTIDTNIALLKRKLDHHYKHFVFIFVPHDDIFELMLLFTMLFIDTLNRLVTTDRISHSGDYLKTAQMHQYLIMDNTYKVIVQS